MKSIGPRSILHLIIIVLFSLCFTVSYADAGLIKKEHKTNTDKRKTSRISQNTKKVAKNNAENKAGKHKDNTTLNKNKADSIKYDIFIDKNRDGLNDRMRKSTIKTNIKKPKGKHYIRSHSKNTKTKTKKIKKVGK